MSLVPKEQRAKLPWDPQPKKSRGTVVYDPATRTVTHVYATDLPALHIADLALLRRIEESLAGAGDAYARLLADVRWRIQNASGGEGKR